MQALGFFVLSIFGIWLILLSVLLWRIFSLFRKLTKGIEATDIKKILEKILSRGDENSGNIKEIEKRLNILEDDGKNHIQKVGLVRFNPFKELGGDHSFSLAILDAHDSGVVITGLHTRDRTRIYMKDIKKGKSGYELSFEEKKALSNARKSG
jgi:hypothetical protein